jgi:hypothetical protein
MKPADIGYITKATRLAGRNDLNKFSCCNRS